MPAPSTFLRNKEKETEMLNKRIQRFAKKRTEFFDEQDREWKADIGSNTGSRKHYLLMASSNELFSFLNLRGEIDNVRETQPGRFDGLLSRPRSSGLGSYTAALAGGVAVTPQIVKNDSSYCPVCGKSMLHMNSTSRQSHVHSCLNEGESSSRLSKKVEDWKNTVDCPLCKQPQAPGPFRAAHIKRCAAKFGVEPKDVLNIVNAQQNVTDALKKRGVNHTSAAFPSREDVVVKRKRDVHLPRSRLDEDMQTALALSLQEGQGQRIPLFKQKSNESIKSHSSTSTSSINSEAGLNAARERLSDMILMNEEFGNRKGHSFTSKLPPLKKSRLGLDPSISSMLFGASPSKSCPTPPSVSTPTFVLQKCTSNQPTIDNLRSFNFDHYNVEELDNCDSTSKLILPHYKPVNPQCQQFVSKSVSCGPSPKCESISVNIATQTECSPKSQPISISIATQTECYGKMDQGTDARHIITHNIETQCQLHPVSPKLCFKCQNIVDDCSKNLVMNSSILKHKPVADTQAMVNAGVTSTDCMIKDSSKTVKEGSKESTGDCEVVNDSFGDCFVNVVEDDELMIYSPSPLDRHISSPDLFDEDSAVGHLLQQQPNIGEDLQKPTSVVDLVSPVSTKRKSSYEAYSEPSPRKPKVDYVHIGSSLESRGKSPVSIGVTPNTPLVPESELWSSPVEQVRSMNEVGLVFSDLEFVTEDFGFKAKIEGVLRAKNMIIPPKSKAPPPHKSPNKDFALNFSFVNANEDDEEPSQTSPSIPKTPADTGIKILKVDNVTPLADYDGMDTPGLRKELSRFGLRPMIRKRATPLLKQIYEKTHPVAGTLNIMKPSDNGDADFSDDDEVENEVLEESTLVKGSSQEEQQEVNESVEGRLVNMFKANAHLHHKVLMYEPIPFDEIHEVMVSQEIKSSKKFLMDFLDKQHITFTLKSNRNEKQKRKPYKKKK